jgi:ankyrin repeat protein
MCGILIAMKYFAALFLLLSACSNNLREHDPERREISCPGVIDNENGQINLKKLKEVLESHKDISVITCSRNGWPILHEACHSGQIDAVKLILAYNEKLDLNAGDFAGSCEGTALGNAVMRWHHEIVELLLKNGADPNGLCGHDNIVTISLAMALYHKDKKMFAILKKYGADINAKDKHGHTEFMRCDNGEHLEQLIQAGADIHATIDGDSKFFCLPSIYNVGADGIEGIVKVLKKYGADINEVRNRHTPLSRLIDGNQFEAAMVLARHGAKLPLNYWTQKYAMPQVDPTRISDAEFSGTLAEKEHNYYKSQYLNKMNDLKCAFELFIELYKANFKNDKACQDRIKKIQEQEQDFEKLFTSYAEKNASIYLRIYPYNYYGSLIDMIDLRIKHLNIHMEQLN